MEPSSPAAGDSRRGAASTDLLKLAAAKLRPVEQQHHDGAAEHSQDSETMSLRLPLRKSLASLEGRPPRNRAEAVQLDLLRARLRPPPKAAPRAQPPQPPYVMNAGRGLKPSPSQRREPDAGAAAVAGGLLQLLDSGNSLDTVEGDSSEGRRLGRIRVVQAVQAVFDLASSSDSCTPRVEVTAAAYAVDDKSAMVRCRGWLLELMSPSAYVI